MTPNDPYLDPDSGVLKNKLGIRDQATLARAEADYSINRIAELRADPLLGQFDLTHLQAIHRFIFQDIYPMAGEIRTIGIEKDIGVQYPHPDHPHADGNLGKRLDYTFSELAKDHDRLRNLAASRTHFIKRLARHIGEIWECHPFREGNTRTCCEFAYQLAANAGLPLLSNFPAAPDEFRDACVQTAFLSMEPLESVFAISMLAGCDSTEPNTPAAD